MYLIPSFLDPRWWELRKRFSVEYGGPFSEVNRKGYVIAIINRGETLLYEDLQGLVHIPISIQAKSIDIKIVSDRLTKTRLDMVLGRVESYFLNIQGYTPRVLF